MSGRIPTDAFSFYVTLGPDRSYQAIADKYDVSKTAVTRHAVLHKWAERLASIEKKAREHSDKRLQETIEELNDRHLRMLKVIEAKALDALRSMPLDSAMDAIRALEISMRQTRLIHGEPTEHTSVQVVDVLQRQHSSWLLKPGSEEDWGDVGAAAPHAQGDGAASVVEPGLPEGESIDHEDATDEPE